MKNCTFFCEVIHFHGIVPFKSAFSSSKFPLYMIFFQGTFFCFKDSLKHLKNVEVTAQSKLPHDFLPVTCCDFQVAPEFFLNKEIMVNARLPPGRLPEAICIICPKKSVSFARRKKSVSFAQGRKVCRLPEAWLCHLSEGICLTCQLEIGYTWAYFNSVW